MERSDIFLYLARRLTGKHKHACNEHRAQRIAPQITVAESRAMGKKIFREAPKLWITCCKISVTQYKYVR